MKIKAGVIGLTALLGLSGSSVALATVVEAVEYYYSGHYFMTISTAEISAVDSGAAGGWARTGYSFKVQNQAIGGYSPMCRFYLTGLARGSHFYTLDAAECAGLKTDAYWKFEGDAFYAQIAALDGLCPTGSRKIYRLYNNRQSGVPNHRYTDDLAIRSQMLGQGWVAEGAGSDGVGFCAEGSSGNSVTDPLMASQNTNKMLGGAWGFSYTSNGSFQRDVFSFTSVANDPASPTSPYYALGSNQYGLPVTARFNMQTGKMEVRSRFAIPATDYFTFAAENTTSGCYHFLPTNASTPTSVCIPFNGSRQ